MPQMKPWIVVRPQTDIPSELRDAYFKAVPPRRGIANPLPEKAPLGRFTPVMTDYLKRELFAMFGLGEYLDVYSGEMLERPIPHSSAMSPMLQSVTDLYTQRAPALFALIAREAKAPIQTFNKVSRIGWPHFNRPVEKGKVALASFEEAAADPDGYLSGAFTVCNVRLQPEPPDKKRTMQFISSDGVVTEKEVGAEDRQLYVPFAPKRTGYADRTRLVFNLPGPNLICQIVDTMINNVIGSWPLTHHNMYDPTIARFMRKYTLAVDVRHMERTTAAVIGVRTALIGGLYETIHNAMGRAGYLVPSNDRKTMIHIAQSAPGWLVQFGSGHSAVSPSQKEILFILLVEAHHQLWGHSYDAACELVKSGNSPQVHMMNFGDDNMFSSDSKEHLDQLFEFLSRYMPVEEELPKKFLGFLWNEQGVERGFRLSHTSYLLRTYLHERPPLGHFRPFPYLGWTLKRQTYMDYGDPQIMYNVYRAEDALLKRVGVPWSFVEQAAAIERRNVDLSIATDAEREALLGREYNLSVEEKLESGRYDGFSPDVTGPLLARLTQGGIFSGVKFT